MAEKLAILIGSVRDGSRTAQVAEIIGNQLRISPGIEVITIDPRDTPMVLPGLSGHAEAAESMRNRLKDAAAFIFVTPEYDGSFSSITKLQIEHLGYPSLMEGRLAAVVGVASGSIGAIKAVEHLKGVLSHIGAIIVPGSLSVARVHDALKESGEIKDPKLEGQISLYSSRILHFIKAHGFGRET